MWQVRVGIFGSQGALPRALNQWSSTFLAPGIWFQGRQFYYGLGCSRMIPSTLYLLCTLFLLLPHQLHLRSSTIKSQMLGTAAIHHLTGGCCLSFCICQALHALKGHWGSHLLVIRILPLKNRKLHLGAYPFFMWSWGVEIRVSRPHLQVNDDTVIYPKPANPECLIIQHLTAACFPSKKRTWRSYQAQTNFYRKLNEKRYIQLMS